jgi:hypothetical protein
MVGYSKVDDWWYDRLVAMGMWLDDRGKGGLRYARLQGSGLKMQHVVLGKWADHKNGNGLDNQESNLRPATRSQQAANHRTSRNSTSGEPGVSWSKRNKKWYVQVMKDKKLVFQKYFTDFDEAVKVVRAKRKEIHGEFVREV